MVENPVCATYRCVGGRPSRASRSAHHHAPRGNIAAVYFAITRKYGYTRLESELAHSINVYCRAAPRAIALCTHTVHTHPVAHLFHGIFPTPCTAPRRIVASAIPRDVIWFLFELRCRSLDNDDGLTLCIPEHPGRPRCVFFGRGRCSIIVGSVGSFNLCTCVILFHCFKFRTFFFTPLHNFFFFWKRFDVSKNIQFWNR